MAFRARILYVVPPSPVYGGIERVVTDIAEQLARDFGAVVEIHVLYCARYEEITSAPKNFTIHYLESDRLRHLFVRLVTFLREQSFDLVIPAQCELSVLVSLAVMGTGTRLVPFLHGNPALEERASLRSRIGFQIYRHFTAKRSAGTLCVSRDLTAYTRQRLPSKGPVRYVPNPVRAFGSAERHIDTSRPFTFLNVGRLSRQKGQDILIAAFAQARREIPDSRLILVGGGSELDAVRELCRSYGVTQSVEIVGRHVDPTAYYQRADCFVLASRWEGFALVLMEALTFGLPLVVTDCDFGPKEIVSDERIGIVTKNEDVASLAAGLVAITRRQDGFAEQAFRRAQPEQHRPDIAAERHYAVLSSILTS
jgi:glycosyltransferase involved in cell wall biosynthesis